MEFSLLQPLNDTYGSHVRWANYPNKDLIVFVPGFGGNATSTWLQFPSFLARPRIRNADVLFFGHNGGKSQMQAIVGLLTEVIDTLWKRPREFPTYPQSRSDHIRYERLYLCGHSMGCVVIRDTVLAGIEGRAPWADHIEMLMFGPAHKGISASLMMIEKYTRATKVLGAAPNTAFNYAYPAAIDLLPESTYLQTLEARTTKAATDFPAVIPRVIAFGEMDKVVALTRFSTDPYPPKIFPKQNHSTVCKPRLDKYEEPFEILENALR